MLKNRVYIGDLIQGKRKKLNYKINKTVSVSPDEWFVTNNAHEAIVSKEKFEKVQNRNVYNVKCYKNSNISYIFKGLVVCGYCGYCMRIKLCYSKKLMGKYYFICPTYRQEHTACIKHSIRNDILEKTVFEIVKTYIDLAIDLDCAIRKMERSKINCNVDFNVKLKQEKDRELINCNRDLNLLYLDFKSGKVSREEYFKNKIEIEEKVSRIQCDIKYLGELINNRNKIVQNKSINNFMKFSDFKVLTNDMVKTLIKKIKIYNDGRIEVDFNFKDDFETALKYLNKNKMIFNI